MGKLLDRLLFDVLMTIYVFPVAFTWWLRMRDRHLRFQSRLFPSTLLAGLGVVLWSFIHRNSDPLRADLGFWTFVIVIAADLALPQIILETGMRRCAARENGGGAATGLVWRGLLSS